jgi:hypothetical protein
MAVAVETGEKFKAKFAEPDFVETLLLKKNGRENTIRQNRLKLMRFVRMMTGWLSQ